MTAPKRLKGNAKKEWNRLTGLLPNLTESDMEMLAQYCESYERYLELQALVAKEGYTCKGKNGVPYQNPTVGCLHKTQELLLKYAKRLRLDPESRNDDASQMGAMSAEDEVLKGLMQ